MTVQFFLKTFYVTIKVHTSGNLYNKEISMLSEQDKVTIKIPRQLYGKLKHILEGSGYNSVTDFIVYVLRDLVATTRKTEDTISEVDFDEIKKRLRNLGYLE